MPNITTNPRSDPHVTKEESPEGRGVNAQTPDTMPRAEDDDTTRAHSPAFHDRPGSDPKDDRQRPFRRG